MSDVVLSSEPAAFIEPQISAQTIPTDKLGSVSLSPSGEFEAGSFASFTLVYTAGEHGIDDSGGLRVVFRFASDQSRPQFERPEAPGYTTVEASNGAVLECRYDPKGNVRPWDRTIQIKVVRGFLKQGDTIRVRIGDTRQGSPGLRLQTFCEDSFEFRVLVDAVATFHFQPLSRQPTIKVVPGPTVRWQAVVPTVVRIDEPFSLKLKTEDRWGNPTSRGERRSRLSSSPSISGLPGYASIADGEFATEVGELGASEPGDYVLELRDENGALAAVSNRFEAVPDVTQRPFWGDLHGQSEETIGTNSARSYFEFARDKAFLDAVSHQGNDFQITDAFWSELNQLTAEFDEPRRYVTLPGYEWSGNTNLGGDRNVYFATENRPIRRSSRALVPYQQDPSTDCTTAKALFDALIREQEDAVCFAHCGGRYADIRMAHDGKIERSIEIHSSWGSFEWLLRDAFEMGYRVGIVANSDGHKGRPGASYPGASLFGAIGGLTCLMMTFLSRENVLDCLRKRHHYGTTGCRMGLVVEAQLSTPGMLYHDDPAQGSAEGHRADRAMMGDIVHLPDGEVELLTSVLGSAPIERADIFNGLKHVDTIRPYGTDHLGSRVRVVWQGAEYRGRFRQTIWDGEAVVSGNEIRAVKPINFFNCEKTLDQVGVSELRWKALTTGNFGGFDLWLKDPFAGTLKIETPLVKCGIPIEDIGLEEERIDAGGLDRALRVFRLPDTNDHYRMRIARKIELSARGDNPIFVRVTQEDGHVAWSSPIYVYR